MYRIVLPAVMLAAIPVGAQSVERRAAMVGGGDAYRGKCTIEVVVDGAAEVSVIGDRGMLRNLSGQPAQWRRFECTGPLPNNPAEFRFAGVDGRGRQDLVRDPRGGGAAVVRIEDRDNGAEGYTFDLFWGGGGGQWDRGGQVDRYGQPDRGGQWDRGGPVNRPPDNYGRGQRFTTEQAIAVCRDEVRRTAMDRYGVRDVELGAMRMDDGPGRNDWVMGTFFLRRDREPHRFACSVNFETGRVRSVEMDQDNRSERWDRGRGTEMAVQRCQREVDDRIRRQGYQDIRFNSINIDDRPGRNDWVIGNARADRGRNSDRFEFSCRVDLATGNIRSVDLGRR